MLVNIAAKLECIGAFLSSGRFWLGCAAGAIIVAGVWILTLRRRLRATQVALNLPFGLGNITYEATDRDRILAWKMYLQLKTRKAALPFDESYDVIIDIFESLHEIFPITRALLSEIRPHQGEAQRSIADFVLRVINDGLRPCLTRWHAKYKTWWNEAISAPEHKGKCPQEVQRGFPQYLDLIEDLKRMNDELAKYAEELLIIVHSSRTRRKKTKKTGATPEHPSQELLSRSPEGSKLTGPKDRLRENSQKKEMS